MTSQWLKLGHSVLWVELQNDEVWEDLEHLKTELKMFLWIILIETPVSNTAIFLCECVGFLGAGFWGFVFI